MKKNIIRKVYWGMTVLFGLAGCNEEKPATFDQINGIYFNNRLLNNTIVDSTNVTFVYTSADTMTVTVKVQALGRPVAYARPIDISVAGGNAIEGTDYELVSVAEMPAEAVNLDYQVQSGNDTTTVIRYRIIFSDRFTVAPESWDEDFGGEFSQQKFELICRVLEIDPAEFNTAGGISLARWQFIYIEMCDYVATQTEKKAAGEEYDEEAFDPTTGEPLFKY